MQDQDNQGPGLIKFLLFPIFCCIFFDLISVLFMPISDPTEEETYISVESPKESEGFQVLAASAACADQISASLSFGFEILLGSDDAAQSISMSLSGKILKTPEAYQMTASVKVMELSDELKKTSAVSGIMSLQEEEILEIVNRGNFTVLANQTKQLKTSIPLEELLRITGASDFQFALMDLKKGILMTPVLMEFGQDNQLTKISTIKPEAFNINGTRIQNFTLTFEVLKDAEIEEPVPEQEEIDFSACNEDPSVLPIHLKEKQDVQDRLFTKTAGYFPINRPDGTEFAQMFDTEISASPGIWNIAAYIAYEESPESFREWYLGENVWDLNSIEVKKACVLLARLGVVEEFREDIPEEEYDSLAESLEDV